MPLDISRDNFDPHRSFAGVLLQQGRVLLDSEANEQVAIFERRIRAAALDGMGPSVVPRTTPDGFRIALVGGAIFIAPGRLYVDGVLAENHGAAPLGWDPTLAGLRGASPVPYMAQPWLPAPPPFVAGKRYLVYADVWQREVTHVERPEIVESALGFDTTGRLQTIWQVRLLEVPADVSCATPDAAISAWVDVTRPSDGRLSSFEAATAVDSDPCLLPPGAGYRGLEHRLYRVEIHDGGAPGSATFKWARHNASVAASISSISADRARVVVDSLGRDAELSIHEHDWVEVTDDARELAGLPGTIHRVGVIDEVSRELPLHPPVPGAIAAPSAGRHPRVRRWDQRGQIRSGATLLQDLDAPGSSGVIDVPLSKATRVHLEDGVEVAFEVVAPSGGATGRFRSGDHWIFTARTAIRPGSKPSVEPLASAPPRGIHHHFARLATVTAGGQVGDCRTLWPPETAHGGCGCTVCVEASDHGAGTHTIQQAIERVIAAGGGTVCLGPGVFELPEPGLRIHGAKGLSLRGHGTATVLKAPSKTSAIEVAEWSDDVTIESLRLVSSGLAAASPIVLRDGVDLRIRRCRIEQVDVVDHSPPLVRLHGVLFGVELSESAMIGASGIANGDSKLAAQVVTADPGGSEPTLLLGVLVDRLVGLFSGAAIALGGSCFFAGPTTVRHSDFLALGSVAVAILGAGGPLAHIDVTENLLLVADGGIAVNLSDARIVGNRVRRLGSTSEGKTPRAAIELLARNGDGLVDRALIADNEVRRARGAGIQLTAALGAVEVRGNRLLEVQGDGIAMSGGASAVTLVVAGNTLRETGRIDAKGGQQNASGQCTGIRAQRCRTASIRDNRILALGRGPNDGSVPTVELCGIAIHACERAVVRGNEIEELGPREAFKGAVVGIQLLTTGGPFDLDGNSVSRDGWGEDPAPDDSEWIGIAIMRPQGKKVIGSASVRMAGPAAKQGSGTTKGPKMSFVWSHAEIVAIELPAALEVALRHCCITGRGGSSLVIVDGATLATALSCRVRRATAGAQQSVVRIVAEGVVVNSNSVVGGERKAAVIELEAGAVAACSAVGNLTDGEIVVDPMPSGGQPHPNVVANARV